MAPGVCLEVCMWVCEAWWQFHGEAKKWQKMGQNGKYIPLRSPAEYSGSENRRSPFDFDQTRLKICYMIMYKYLKWLYIIHYTQVPAPRCGSQPYPMHYENYTVWSYALWASQLY
jgi:hypothetical protein